MGRPIKSVIHTQKYPSWSYYVGLVKRPRVKIVYANNTISCWGRLAQMVERALWKFSSQRECGLIPASPRIFSDAIDIESSKYAMEFGHIPMSRNQGVSTIRVKQT